MAAKKKPAIKNSVAKSSMTKQNTAKSDGGKSRAESRAKARKLDKTPTWPGSPWMKQSRGKEIGFERYMNKQGSTYGAGW